MMKLTYVAHVLFSAQALELRAPATPDRVEQLLLDINQTMSKATHDADLIFATVSSYDRQIESSIKREISALDQTYTKLSKMKAKYAKEASRTGVALAQLAAATTHSTEDSQQQTASEQRSAAKVRSMLGAIDTLVAVLQRAGVTAHGALITAEALDPNGEPGRVAEALRHILAASGYLRPRFEDVFKAFSPPTFAQLRGHKERKHKRLHMTPELLQRTVTLLKQVQRRFRGDHKQALVQRSAREEHLSGVVADALTHAGVLSSAEADSRRRADEVAFSLDFTEAVRAMDRDFVAALEQHAVSKARLRTEIGAERGKQQGTLRSLAELLDHGSSAPSVQAWSFVQTQERPHLAALEMSVETAIHSNQDTHQLLLQLKAQMDTEVPVDAGSVQKVQSHLDDVLRAVETQPRKDEVRRRCERAHAAGEKEASGLRALADLARSDGSRTKEATRAGETNLRGVVAKSSALTKSGRDFRRVSATVLGALEAQSQDRAATLSAVRRASAVELGGTKAAVWELLQELAEQLSAQERAESAFREQQAAGEAEFAAYVQGYVQLLGERQHHYEASLSALKLYAGEIARHHTQETAASGGEEELNAESAELCRSLLATYERRSERRRTLRAQLQGVAAQVPNILLMNNGQDTQKEDDTDFDVSDADSVVGPSDALALEVAEDSEQ